MKQLVERVFLIGPQRRPCLQFDAGWLVLFPPKRPLNVWNGVYDLRWRTLGRMTRAEKRELLDHGYRWLAVKLCHINPANDVYRELVSWIEKGDDRLLPPVPA